MTLNGYKLRDQVSITKLNIASPPPPNGIHKCPKIGVWPNAINVVKHAMKRNEPYSACNVRYGFQAFLKAHINSYNFSFGQKIKKKDPFFEQLFTRNLCFRQNWTKKCVYSTVYVISS